MKTFLKLAAFACAVALGVFLAIYFSGKRDQSTSKTTVLKNYEQLDWESLDDQQLLVVNVLVEGSEASEKLAVILEKIQVNRTFGDRVIVSQIPIEANPGYAREHNVNLTDFRGHLNFFAKGREFKPLKHIVDEQIVIDQIQAYLDGLVKRFDRDWRPPVPGMEQRSALGAPAGR